MLTAVSSYGHSMGGILAFETAHYLDEAWKIKPNELIIGACLPPQFYSQSQAMGLAEGKKKSPDFK